MGDITNAIIEKVRQHPKIAGLTVIGVLALFIRYVLGQVFVDAIGRVLWIAVGKWLGVTDVNTLANILSYVIPAILSAALLWIVYLAARRDSGGSAPSEGAPIARYDTRKIEALRAAARGLRDVAWGMPLPQAQSRLDDFRAIADYFVREPQFAELLPKIWNGAQRLAVMANKPPAGPDAADPVAQATALQETHTAIDQLLAVTDSHILYSQPRGEEPATGELDRTRRRRALIADARAFVAGALKSNKESPSFEDRMQMEPFFMTIWPHLSKGYTDDFNSDVITVMLGSTSEIPVAARLFINELDRLEKEWGVQI